jgi:hypothetical protein
MERRSLKLGLTVVLGAAVLAASGYLSSLVSLSPCADSARGSLGEYIEFAQVPRSVRWLEAEELADRWAAGMPNRELLIPEYRRLDRFVPLRLFIPNTEPPLPWGYVKPSITAWPFIVRVDYGCAMKPLYAKFGTQVYVAFFGLRVRVGDWPVLLW